MELDPNKIRATRAARETYDQKMARMGFVRLQYRIHQEDRDKVREYVEQVRKRRLRKLKHA